MFTEYLFQNKFEDVGIFFHDDEDCMYEWLEWKWERQLWDDLNMYCTEEWSGICTAWYDKEEKE